MVLLASSPQQQAATSGGWRRKHGSTCGHRASAAYSCCDNATKKGAEAGTTLAGWDHTRRLPAATVRAPRSERLRPKPGKAHIRRSAVAVEWIAPGVLWEQAMQPSVESVSSGSKPLPPLPRAFVGSQSAYEQICAYGCAMGWSDKPFDFVVQQWLASRPQRCYRELLASGR
jgi:hypothetical protein